MTDTSVRLVLVTRQDKHRFFQNFLMSASGMDGVHPIKSREELLEFRLGDNQYSTKRTFVLVSGSESDPQVLSAIYTRSGTRDFTNIEDVLEERATHLQEDPTHYQFYSVTNVLGDDNRPLLGGAAKKLIGLLKEFLEDETGFESSKKTISPFRTFKGFLANKDITSEDFRGFFHWTQLGHVLEHFCERHPRNLAQRAHMPNGAVLREVYMNAADPGKPDELCMVAYDYTLSKDELLENAQRYMRGEYPVDSALEGFLPQEGSGGCSPSFA